MKRNCLLLVVVFCSMSSYSQGVYPNPDLVYRKTNATRNVRIIDRNLYKDHLYGFWLGSCIANWTGLVTEMDKIGNIGELKTGAFYTGNDWAKPDQPSIWGNGIPSNLSSSIDFVYATPDSIWGSDDDTDIEYIYQELLLQNKTSLLTGEQIRDGWLAHIKHEEENYLWVSNQSAFNLMLKGMVPPETGDSVNNTEYDMIDGQLTTELFGLFSPTRPDFALEMAKLPIKNVARENSEWVCDFYVSLFSLASAVDEKLSSKDKIVWMAEHAKKCLPPNSYVFKMYHFVKKMYDSGYTWEQARDSVYVRYQVNQLDGYTITSRNLYCNGCFASGINFASSLVSLFYGQGDIIQTIKIAVLCGWDSDNPAATWGGLLGFMIGKSGIEKAFNKTFSDRYNIHRTRIGFPNNGIDTFNKMAVKGIWIIDRVVQEELKGSVDLKKNKWYIPIEY